MTNNCPDILIIAYNDTNILHKLGRIRIKDNLKALAIIINSGQSG